MSQLAHYNPEIDQKIGEVKMTRYLNKCGKQQKLKQKKPEQQKKKRRETQERENNKDKESSRKLEDLR